MKKSIVIRFYEITVRRNVAHRVRDYNTQKGLFATTNRLKDVAHEVRDYGCLGKGTSSLRSGRATTKCRSHSSRLQYPEGGWSRLHNVAHIVRDYKSLERCCSQSFPNVAHIVRDYSIQKGVVRDYNTLKGLFATTKMQKNVVKTRIFTNFYHICMNKN